MQFDKKYFDQLYEFFNCNNNETYNVEDLATDTEKFVAYVRLYQYDRTLKDAEVLLSFDEKQIRITEFFDNVLNSQKTEALKATMYIQELKDVANTPLTQSIEPVLSKPASVVTQPAVQITQTKKSPW